jgi:hypothetical protein
MDKHVEAFVCHKLERYVFVGSQLLSSDDKQQSLATSDRVQRHQVRGAEMVGVHRSNVLTVVEPIHLALEESLRNGQRYSIRV